MRFKVLITTSGIGSRIGNITKFTNKSLTKVGDKPALSYIVEAYPEDIELIVTVGHFGNHIKQFLKLAYPNRKISFVDVDNYDKLGSSLAYSILQAQKQIDCPFIFHACDTIVRGNIPKPDHNWLGGFQTYINNEHYVSFDTIGEAVSKIREKGEFGGDYSYIGLAGIYNYEDFFSYLWHSYLKNKFNSQLSDVTSIKLMIERKHQFKYYNFVWYDIGNIESLKNTRSQICSSLNVLDKDDEAIYLIDNYVVKFFHDNGACKNRVNRAKNLKGLVPDIVDSSENFYKYIFIPGTVLADCVTENIFNNFLKWSKQFLWKERTSIGDFKQVCYDFYFEKTRHRIKKFLENSGIKDEACNINGLIIPPIEDMLQTINVNWLCGAKPYQIHGDYLLDNTLYIDKNNFILVDWRQDFGGNTEIGDIYYDLAKLNHNLIFNHDIVNKELFEININDKISCDILRKHTLVSCQKILFDFIKENHLDSKKVSTLTAIIWINMAALHHYPLNNFLFYFGKFNLFKALNETP